MTLISNHRARNKLRLTKKAVESIASPPTGEILVWDSDLAGFGVRVSVSGRRTYFIQTRAENGQQVKLKLGVHGAVAAEQARSLALRELGKIAGGGNPAAERRLARTAERQRLVAPMMRDLAVQYLHEYAEVFKRPSTVEDDKSLLGLREPRVRKKGRTGPKRKAVTILSEFGARKVADITRRDISDLHRKMHSTPAQANRMLALLSKMFNLAVQWELRPDNPVRGLMRYPEQPRERYLNAAELRRLAVALTEHANTIIANAIKLLMLTGARRSEVLTATWNQFDLNTGVWVKPSAHTKQKRTHRVPLSPAAVELLRTVRGQMLKRAADGGTVVSIDKLGGQVFPGRFGVRPLTDIKKSWAQICKAADLQGVRLHDLRHTYAALLASDGMSLPIIGQLLGHTQPSTTARYAHLLDDPLRRATSRVGDTLMKLAAPLELAVMDPEAAGR